MWFPLKLTFIKSRAEKIAQLQTFHCSKIGSSHTKSNKVCQDFAISYLCKQYAVAIVCDGHGGERYIRSHIGSKKAGEVCLEAINVFFGKRGENQLIKFEPSPEKTLKQLSANIIFRWREEVEKDYQANPFTEAETLHLSDLEKSKLKGEGWIKTYGTTLITVVRTNDFWFGLHIGDGKCVVVSENGDLLEPIPWDDKCFLNSTTSLSDSDTLSSFRYFFSKENLPVALFAGTDGIDDSLGGTAGLHSFYDALLKTLKTKGIEEGVKDLEEYLPKLSEKGSGDDVSVAGIIVLKSKNAKNQF
jgi:hypothetical protein